MAICLLGRATHGLPLAFLKLIMQLSLGNSLFFPGGTQQSKPRQTFKPDGIGACIHELQTLLPIDDPGVIHPVTSTYNRQVLMVYFAFEHHVDEHDFRTAFHKMCFTLRSAHEQRAAFNLPRAVLYGIICSGTEASVYPSWMLDNVSFIITSVPVFFISRSLSVHREPSTCPIERFHLSSCMLKLA